MPKKPEPSAPSDHSWMEIALEEARLASSEDEVPVGAVIVRGQELIARAHNRKEQNQDPTGHAEILAILAASRELQSWRLEGATLYVTLEPCPMCLGAAQQARIAKIVYGTPDLKGGAISLGYRLHEDLRTNHRFEAVLESNPECSSLLSEFFKRKRAARSHSDHGK